MIYIDTSVALAQLLAENRVPPAELWDEVLISSRLIEYEIWTRIHSRKLGKSHGEQVRSLVGRMASSNWLLSCLLERSSLFPRQCVLSTLFTWHPLSSCEDKIRRSSWQPMTPG